jgi:AcrR family transcriptional regulator
VPFHVKAPKQPRSRNTLERIERAGLEILTESGRAALTVQAVAVRARSSIGSFYARFRGKEDFLSYLETRLRENEAARWAARVQERPWGTRGLEGAIEHAVALLADEVRDRLRRDAALGTSPEVRRASTEALLEELEVRLLAHRDEMAHPEPELMVRLGLAASVGLLETGFLEAAKRQAPEATIMREARSLLGTYLRHAERRPHGDPVDFFETWG